jgi:hypothetical protein
MFAAEFELAQISDRRRVRRAPVAMDAKLERGGLGRALCRVINVSAHGVRLHTYTALRKGGTIWLTLPRIGQIAADVVWADDFAAGCEFRTKLTTDQFASLAEVAV